MNRKNLAVGTIIVLVSSITLAAFFIENYGTLQSINPIAATAAIAVIVVGVIWFKKTNK